MLADPQSITVGGTAIPLPRTAEIGSSADYSAADGSRNMRVSQRTTRDVRRTSISLQSHKIAPDALTAVNRRVSATVSVNVTSPLDGFTVDELVAELQGLVTLLTASSAATAKRILAGEK